MLFKIGIPAALIFIIDRILKAVATSRGDGYFIFGRAFRFELVENPGLALNIPIPHIFFIPLNIFFLGLLIYFAFLWGKRCKRGFCITTSERMALALMIAGGLSNVIDRVLYDVVIDYLVIQAGAHRLAFNIGDISVVVGAFLLIFLPTYYESRSKHL